VLEINSLLKDCILGSAIFLLFSTVLISLRVYNDRKFLTEAWLEDHIDPGKPKNTLIGGTHFKADSNNPAANKAGVLINKILK
jgi:hypothetical protein